MRKKIGTVLDEELLWKAKKAALEHKESFSSILEEALKLYLQYDKGKKKGRTAQRTRGIMKISSKTLQSIMQEEEWYES